MPQKPENSLFDMIWGLDRSGYIVTPENQIIPKKHEWAEYWPMRDYPGLARKFASLSKNKKGIIEPQAAIAFACQYGQLGLDGPYGIEGLDRWQETLLAFRYMFDCIDKGKKDDALYYYNGNQMTAAPVKLLVTMEEQPWKRTLQVVPTTLNDAMWLMVANEISAGIQLQNCIALNCNEWFKARTNKHFCSDACKMMMYRERKAG